MFTATARSQSFCGWFRFLVGICCWLPCLILRAQQGPVLSPTYFASIQLLHDGEYPAAQSSFEGELRGSIKIGTQRWLDSVCFSAMLGESHYRQGNFEKASEAFGQALTLYLDYTNWMLSVRFPQNLQAVPPTKFPWGVRPNGARVARVPDTMLMEQGRPVTSQTLQQGGVVSQPRLMQVPVQEITRCVVLSLKRRRDLLGPVAPHDQLNNTVLDALQKATLPPNSWSKAWHDAKLGAALYATGNKGQAIAVLKSSLLIAGEFDHPLTAYSLTMLGQMSLEDGKYDEADAFFAQATLCAAETGDYMIMEEAFRQSLLIHVLQNRKGVFAALAPATGWAKRQRARELQTSLLLLAAESSGIQRQTKAAQVILTEARGIIARSPMGAGEIGARLNYVAAIIEYQSGRLVEGNKAISAALGLARQHSRWLYQLAVTTSRLTAPAPTITEGKALPIYERLADDPFPNDWAERPLDSLVTLTTPHQPTFDIWFELVLAKNDWDKAFDIADKAKRHRFFNSQPLGGRLTAVRYLLHASPELLDNTARTLRQNLLVAFPEYQPLVDAVEKVKVKLAELPLSPTKPEQIKQQSDLMAEWGKLTLAQECLIAEIAVRREATPLVYPRSVGLKSLQAQLPQGQVALITHATARNLHAVLLSKTRYATWRVENPQLLERKILSLLRAIGNFDANRELNLAQLQDQSWKTAAREVTDTFLQGSKVNFGQAFDELVIVPDGMLWYLPWELLQVNQDDTTVTFINKTRIRYAPTNGFILEPRSARPLRPELGVVVGKLHPRIDTKALEPRWQEWSVKFPGIKAVRAGLNFPSLYYGGLIDQLVVADDLAPSDPSRPLAWSLTNLDKSSEVAAVSNFYQLPWKRLDVVALPGFHTPAESTIGNNPRLAGGQELFLTACTLMSHGARTVLLTRWRPGGGSSLELVRNFLQELPDNSASGAWQRSVLLAGEAPLDPHLEPRIRLTNDAPELTTAHPFFWGPFMLFDTGTATPQSATAPPVEPPPMERPKLPDLPPVPGKEAPPPVPPIPGGPQPAEKNGDAGPMAPQPGTTPVPGVTPPGKRLPELPPAGTK